MAKLVIGCECTNDGNLGLPQEYCKPGVIIGYILQNRYKSDGTENVIDLNVSAITNEFTSLLTTSDKTSRLYPITNTRKFEQQNGEDVNVTDNQGVDEFVRVGDRKFTDEKWSLPPLFTEKLNARNCIEQVIYFITEKGILGRKVGNNWKGVPLVKLRAIHNLTTGGDVEKAMLSGQLGRDFNVGEFWFMKKEDLNLDFNDLVGFADVNITIADAAVDGGTNTTVGLKMRSDFGNGPVSGTDVLGLVLADLSIYNVTTSTVITGVSLTEIEGVKYTLTFPSQTTADIVRISVNATGQRPYLEGKIEIVQPA